MRKTLQEKGAQYVLWWVGPKEDDEEPYERDTEEYPREEDD